MQANILKILWRINSAWTEIRLHFTHGTFFCIKENPFCFLLCSHQTTVVSTLIINQKHHWQIGEWLNLYWLYWYPTIFVLVPKMVSSFDVLFICIKFESLNCMQKDRMLEKDIAGDLMTWLDNQMLVLLSSNRDI